jgi:twinkle protein
MRTGFNEAGLGTSGPISQNTNRTSYGTGGSRSPTLSTYYGGKKSTLTESKYIKHIPCEACGSSDANSLFDDGHQYCFACETYVAGDGTTTKVSKKPMNKELKFYDSATYLSIVDRSITSATCIAFGVKQDNGKHYYPYYNPDGSMVAIKTRSVEDKAFSVAGDFKDATLFGQNLFAKSGRYLTICEGELDALASYQMQGSKYPCVSIRSGASGALKDCKAQYEWIDSFETIVLAFDADEPGQKAAQAVAELFGGKVKIMKHRTGYKDACDYLENNASKEFVDTWWGAESYIPDGIVQGNSLWDMVSAPIEKADCDYPYEALNKLTYGIRKGELVMVTAGSGLGKSQFLREIVWHILNKTTDNIGLMFLEEGVRKTARSLMSLAINKPIHLPDVEVSPEELKDAFDRTLGSDRVYLFDHFGSTSLENIINRVRYMAKGLGCGYVFLDHISIIVSGGDVGDERKALDAIMTKLRMIVQETGISLICVSHLKRNEGRGHEEGAVTSLAQLRGSGAIAQLSDIVIGLERNGQAEDQIERNTTSVRVLKNRFSGYTGNCGALLYNGQTGRMLEIKDTL